MKGDKLLGVYQMHLFSFTLLPCVISYKLWSSLIYVHEIYLMLMHCKICWNRNNSTMSVHLASAALSWKIACSGLALTYIV